MRSQRRLGLQNANFLSRITFSFVNPLISLGWKNSIDEGTARDFLPDGDQADILLEDFEEAFQKAKLDAEGKRPERKDSLLLWKTFCKLYQWKLVAHFVLSLAEVASRVGAPVLLRQLLDFLSQASQDEETSAATRVWRGYMWAAFLSATSFSYLIFHHQVFFFGMRNGFLMRIQAIAAVYSKALRLNSSSVAKVSSGQIINLVSNDVRRFDEASTFWVFLLCGPIELMIVFVLVGLRLNFASAAAGVSALLALIPMQALLARRISQLRSLTTRSTDERVRLVSEGVQGILAVKMLAWETLLLEKIKSFREREAKPLRQISYIRAMNMALTWCMNPVASLCCFATARYTGAVLTVANLFYAIALLNLLRLSMCEFFTHAVEAVSELRVSLRRINDFLLLPEPPQPTSENRHNGKGSQKEESQRLEARIFNNRDASDKMKTQNRVEDVVVMDQAEFDWRTNSLGTRTDERNSEGRPERSGRECAESGPHVFIVKESISQNDGRETLVKTDEVSLPQLKHVVLSLSLRVRRGELLAVVGPVGSGKSSLIAALLGELQPCNSSTVHVRGSIAYVGQIPWIMSETVRNNILFGLPYREGFYSKVVWACSLSDDLKAMVAGDLTEIGERGISISGGQKARLALARAAYSQADIQLLDDPLSAVDPKVARHLFHCCIGPKGILGSSTRILVTHQRQFLPMCDRIIVVRDGRIVAEGSCQELIARDVPEVMYDSALPAETSDDVEVDYSLNEFCYDDVETEEVDAAEAEASSETHSPITLQEQEASVRSAYDHTSSTTSRSSISILRSLSSRMLSRNRKPSGRLLRRFISGIGKTGPLTKDSSNASNHLAKGSAMASYIAESIGRDSGRLVVKEDKDEGSVRWTAYVEMFKLFGLIPLVLIAIGLLGGQATVLYSEYWLARWAAADASNQMRSVWIWAYGCMVGGIVLVFLSRAFLFFFSALSMATKLHDAAMNTVFRAPLPFFHTNPTGRILNRFSKDQGIIDEQLSVVAFDALQAMMAVIGALILLAVVVPYILPLFVPLGFAFVWIQRRYLKTSRELKRFEAVTRSPLYASLSEALRGLSTIRAFNASKRFIDNFLEKLSDNAAWWFAWLTSARWIGFRLDFLVSIILTVAPFLVVTVREHVSPQLSGLALTQSLYLAGLLQWMTRQTAEFEVNMTSVERLLRYCKLPQEPPTVGRGGSPPPKGWPVRGSISYDAVTILYRKGLSPVLRNITFELEGGTSCGIVGRTGSGKSSLMLSLFRLIPVVDGKICIDGVDTSSIGIDVLRRNIAIIPQDPVIFSGTLRSNLSLWGSHTDANIWEALRVAQLHKFVAGLGGLDAVVAEDGSNFSVGQRQLLCLARALLADAKILAADEATANVDLQTAAAIQYAMNESISRNRTLILIAHRIDTVMHCDQLLVLSEGELVEKGPPRELATVSTGHFHAMVQAARRMSI